MFALASIVLGSTAVWLLDDFLGAMANHDVNGLVPAILAVNTEATIVIASQKPVAFECFDRLIELERGRVVYNGPTAARTAKETVVTVN